MMTASTTTYSEPIGDFLALRGKRPNWRGPGHAWTRQRPARLTLSGHFGGLSPAEKSRFPETETVKSGDPVRMRLYCEGRPSISC